MRERETAKKRPGFVTPTTTMLLRVGKLARARCGSGVVGAALLRTSCPHASFGAGQLLGSLGIKAS